MVANISNDGHDVVVYDANKDVANALVGNKVTAVVWQFAFCFIITT